MKSIKKLNKVKSIKKIFRYFNLDLRRYYPQRFAILKAKDKFMGKEIIACEIGVFDGEHAYQILKHLNIKKLYLIDPYTNNTNYKGDPMSNSNFLSLAKSKAKKLLKPFKDKIVWIEKLSKDAIGDIKEKLDFIYIDGNHFYPHIDNDLENYYTLLKQDGIFSGHDFSDGWIDVVIAINKFAAKRNLNIFASSGDDWVLFKDSEIGMYDKTSTSKRNVTEKVRK